MSTTSKKSRESNKGKETTRDKEKDMDQSFEKTLDKEKDQNTQDNTEDDGDGDDSQALGGGEKGDEEVLTEDFLEGDVTMGDICDKILTNLYLCPQENKLKKLWWVCDSRTSDTAKDLVDEPMLSLNFMEDKETLVDAGLVVHCFFSDYRVKAKNSNKQTKKTSLILLCLGGRTGLLTVVVEPTKFDKNVFKKFPDDYFLKSLERTMAEAPVKYTALTTWFFEFLTAQEKAYFPLVQDQYKALTGLDLVWKSPKRIKVRHPRGPGDENMSKNGEGGGGKGSELGGDGGTEFGGDGGSQVGTKKQSRPLDDSGKGEGGTQSDTNRAKSQSQQKDLAITKKAAPGSAKSSAQEGSTTRTLTPKKKRTSANKSKEIVPVPKVDRCFRKSNC